MHDSAFDSVLFDLDDEFVFESDEDKVHGMIDRFMRDNTQERSVAPTKNERGRPRKHFTKKVTMIEVEASGWLKKAGRGRPKKGERRIEVVLPLDVEIASGKFYVHTNGILREANP
jgi:hypothetical protein